MENNRFYAIKNLSEVFKKESSENQIIKYVADIKFMDLLKFQNKFNKFNKNFLNIKLELDGKFQEWLKEIYKEHNFKNSNNRKDELIKLTECLPLFLELFELNKSIEIYNADYWFDNFRKGIDLVCLENEILNFKSGLWSNDFYDVSYGTSFYSWIHICKLRGFKKEDIIKTYLRINKC